MNHKSHFSDGLKSLFHGFPFDTICFSINMYRTPPEGLVNPWFHSPAREPAAPTSSSRASNRWTQWASQAREIPGIMAANSPIAGHLFFFESSRLSECAFSSFIYIFYHVMYAERSRQVHLWWPAELGFFWLLERANHRTKWGDFPALLSKTMFDCQRVKSAKDGRKVKIQDLPETFPDDRAWNDHSFFNRPQFHRKRTRPIFQFADPHSKNLRSQTCKVVVRWLCVGHICICRH